MNALAVSRRVRLAFRIVTAALVCLHLATALADPIRVVTYNVQADTGGYTTVRPGFYTVIQGIGDEVVNGNAQPIDILALQETTSNTTTVAPIVTQLNTIYGAATYAMSTYQATQNGSPSSGNGPNAMVYHTSTLQLIASVGIGTPSTSGFPRQPVRYQFRPVGGDASLDFYVYVSHAKAGTGSSNENRRNIEAQAIRTNELTLPATARVLYVGDWNLTGSSEAAYQTLLGPGQGQGFDPPDRPGDWETNPAFVDVMTYSPANLRYRDDFQLVTQNVMSDPNGLLYTAGSFHSFANNGSVPLYGSLNSPGNTAVPGLPNRAAVLSALTTASDHIPVVADYDIPLGAAPTITSQPTNQTACTSGSASFAVAASGSPAPTYQWREGTTNLTNGGNISGATTATLTINPVGSGDAATNYNCVATNSNGSATSNNATLTVNVGVSLTAQPQSQTKCTGQSATFSVTASGTAPLSYQWRKNSGNIGGATGSSYTINPVATGDAADYDCVVTNGCGSATSDAAALTVNTAPTITGQPQSTVAHTGQSVTLSATATGTPPLGYQWRKGGGSIGGATGSSYTISPVTLANAGNYDCVITNSCGSPVTTNVAVLTVWLTDDLNCDGVIDNFDINAFVLALTDPTAYAAAYPGCYHLNADSNNDGVIDNFDINPFVALLTGG